MNWKKTVKSAVTKYWDNDLRKGANKKSSLCHIHWGSQNSTKLEPHSIWKSTADNLNLAKKALLKTKVLLHVYPLQKGVDFSKGNSTCPLCKGNDLENEIHFLASCMDLTSIKERELFQKQMLAKELISKEVAAILFKDNDLFAQLALDHRKLDGITGIATDEKHHSMMIVSLNYVFKLHLNRSTKLQHRM